MDPTATADGMFQAIRGWLARELAPLFDRIKSLEARPEAPSALEVVRALQEFRPRDGKDGDPGRDAADIHILDGIDPTRSYPGGTFAAHDGGLIRSVRVTDPIDGDLAAAGWRIVVNGLKGIDTAIEDGGRSLSLTIKTTAGDVVHAHRTAVPVERGVHRDGKGYEAGDVVEWAGAAWIATQDAPVGKPDTSEDWRRLVRRGRDGASVPQARARA